MTNPTFVLDQDQLNKLFGVSNQLHAGTDKERDLGHQLWLVLNDIRNQEIPTPANSGR